MFDDTLIHLTGRKSLSIENYKSILDYTESKILIQGKKEKLMIKGKDFRIDYFTQDNMRITGVVEGIEFLCSGTKSSGGHL